MGVFVVFGWLGGSGFVCSARGSDADAAIVNGKALMQGSVVRTLDEKDALEQA